MSFSKPFFRHGWVLILLGAALFVAATDRGRIAQLKRVSLVGREDATTASAQLKRHSLVAPEHHSRTYQWLSETEEMLARGEWRIREVNFENAPVGREVHAASPYRWWLGALSRFVPSAGGASGWTKIESAALWTGPLLHLLVLVGSTVFVARRFGVGQAALVAVGLAAMFPLGGEFLPGIADDRGLVIAIGWASLLLLLDGLRHQRKSSFSLSGVAGGLGLWMGVAVQVPLLAGIGLGALAMIGWEKFARVPAPATPRPWNLWALAGAATSLLAYGIEYFRRHMEMRLEANHPMYGLAWLGLGIALTLAESWRAGGKLKNFRSLSTGVIALIAIAALPVAMALLPSAGFLAANPQAARLTSLPNGPVAGNLALWLHRDGPSLELLATFFPFLLLLPVTIVLCRRGVASLQRAAAIAASGVVLGAMTLGCAQLQWWSVAQLALLALLVVATPTEKIVSWTGLVLAAGLFLPGAIHLARSARASETTPFTRLEIEGLVERDIAHFIADRVGVENAIVLTAPERTPGFWFHGGLRGLGSPNWENREGVAATVRILGATTLDEAQALLNQRGITHLVLTSWDTEMDEFVRWTRNTPADTFLAALRRWAIPPWLQPLPYRLPEIAGFEGQSVVILKVTDNTDRALSLSRLAEYAVETQNPTLAAAIDEALQTHAGNLSAAIGRAQLAKNRDDARAFAGIFASIQQSLSNQLDRTVPWDRRLSLAVVLAQGNQPDLARVQLQRCVAEINEVRIRGLGDGALYRLLVLSKALDVPIAQPNLRELALSLLPAEARSRL